MSTPDKPLLPSDDQLRSAFDFLNEPADAFPPPPPLMWDGVQTRLQPARPLSRAARWRTGVGGALMGALLTLLFVWWGAPEVAEKGVAPRLTTVVGVTASAGDAVSHAGDAVSHTRNVVSYAGTANSRNGNGNSLNGIGDSNERIDNSRNGNGGSLNEAAISPVADDLLPLVGSASPPVPAVLQPLLTTELTLAALPADTNQETRERRRRTLREQRAALAALTRRTDSLLLALNDAAFAPPPPPQDSTTETAAPAHRWSVALAFAPERNFFGLQGPVGDTLSALRRTHEQGRAGFSAALLAEYRVDTRLSVGAGLGLTSYGAELRLTDHRTTVTTRFDTVTTQTVRSDTVTTSAYLIRLVRDSVLAPILNYNNQVIGYQYLPITRYDTVWTHLTHTQQTTHTTTTYTPTVTTRQELRARVLKPNYRFLTVPVLLRFRLGRVTDWDGRANAPRWWADVAVGAQLQFFLGGTQAYTVDGLTYYTQRVGPTDGPFRPFNVAVTGAVAVNYALTPRLSASLAPALRYQLESVYKPSTNLTQRPTATGVQVGLKYAF